MANMALGYLSHFPVEYHRSQIASGEIGVEPRRETHPVEISFGRGFGQGRNHGADSHNAIDIMGAPGLRIVASCSGVVAETWRTRDGEFPGAGTSADGGNFVMIIDDRDGLFHYYAHMQNRPLVTPGKRVTSGTLLGSLGDTGRARGTPPHLHYQVSHRNARGILQSFVNPYPCLFQLAARWNPSVSPGGHVVLSLAGGGPSG